MSSTSNLYVPDKQLNLACVFGNPIEQSKSPIIHALFAKQFDIPLDYQKRFADQDAFRDAANTFFSNPQCIGANVTMPFKGDAYSWVDTLADRARRAGAVNTIIKTNNGYVGDNSDGVGLCNDLLHHHVTLKNANVLMIGAGGAAKGALPALIEAGVASITLFNRDQNKAKELINYTRTYASPTLSLYQASVQEFDLIINATSLSLNGHLPNISADIFTGAPSVYDMVYMDKPTVFLDYARSHGCINCIDGLGMLIEQAAFSFYLWFGVKPNTEEVNAYLREQR